MNIFKMHTNVIDVPIQITYRNSPITLSDGDHTNDDVSGVRRRLSLKNW